MNVSDFCAEFCVKLSLGEPDPQVVEKGSEAGLLFESPEGIVRA